MRRCRRQYHRATLAAVVDAAAVLIGTACGATESAAAKDPAAASVAATKAMTDYVGGHWIPFTSAKPLSPAQWAVVDGYANFSSAALAVYSTRSAAPLATVVSAHSGVAKMFTRDLASGKNPEALYTKATVEAVAVHGCRASLTVELYYPGGRSLHYVSYGCDPSTRPGSPTSPRASQARRPRSAAAWPPWRPPSTPRGSSPTTTGSARWTHPCGI